MIDECKSIFGKSSPPRASDVLFGASQEGWRLNACIEHWGDVEHAYKAGFREASSQLVEHMCKEPSNQDYLVYPIVYLYRHHIEMVLKDIFRLSVDLLEKPMSNRQEKKLKAHNLSQLWDMIRPNLAPICDLAGEAALPLEDLNGIDAYMNQLNAHDPGGQSFRYARQQDMTRTLDVDLVHINIRSFAIHMEKLADYLDGLEGWLQILADGRNNIRFE
jgi:hypothetical protein